MKFELKNFKWSNFSSHETYCFQASVTVDGRRLFYTHNSGRGEANHVDMFKGISRDALQPVIEWVKTQPGYENDHHLDYYISYLVGRELLTQDLTKLLKKNLVFFIRDGEKETIKCVRLSALNQLTRDSQKAYPGSNYRQGLIDGILKKYPGAVILNDIGFKDAYALYTVRNTPESIAAAYDRIAV